MHRAGTRINKRSNDDRFYFHSSYLTDLIRASDPKDLGRSDIGRQLEYSDEIARSVGRRPAGVYVPVAALATRDLTVGTATAGGHTVATNLLADRFIDILRPYSVTAQARPTTLQGLKGDVAIPRQTSAATAYWVGEGGAPTESQQAFDQVPLSPKTLSAYTDMSRRLLKQSSVVIDNFVKRDLLATIGLEVDRAALAGSGTGNEPTGIINTAGVNSLTLSDAIPTWGDIVDMQTEANVDNVTIDACRYVITPEMKGRLTVTEKVAGTGKMIWEDREKALNNQRVIVSNQLPKNGGSGSSHTMLFANFTDLVIGMWDAVDLLVDPYTFSTSGGLRIAAFHDVDIAVRHPESFVVVTDAGV